MGFRKLRSKFIILFVSLLGNKDNYLQDDKGNILLDSNYRLLKK